MILSNMLRILISITCLLVVSFTNGQAYYEHLTIEDGLSSNCIRSIFRDSKNRMWIGTENGIGIWENGNFVQINQPLIGNNIWNITEDHRNRIWFSNYGRGVSCWDNGKITYLDEKKGLKYSTVRKIKSFKKNVYFGAENGLSVLLENGKLIHWKYTKKKELYSNYPFQVMDFLVYNDEIYIATRDGDIKKISIIDNKIIIKPFLKKTTSPILGAYIFKNWLYLSNEYTRRLPLKDFFHQNFSRTDTLGKNIIWEYTNFKGKLYGACWGVNTNVFGLFDVSSNVGKSIIQDEHFGWTISHTNNEIWYGTLDNGIYIVRPQEICKVLNNQFPWGEKSKLIDFDAKGGTEAYLTQEGVHFKTNGQVKTVHYQQFLKDYVQRFNSQHPPHPMPVNIREPYAIQFTKVKFCNDHWIVLSRVGMFLLDPKTFEIKQSMVDFYSNFVEFENNQYLLAYEYRGLSASSPSLLIKDFNLVQQRSNFKTPILAIYMTKIGKDIYWVDNDLGLFKYANGMLSPITTTLLKKGIAPIYGTTTSNGKIGIVTNDNKITIIEPKTGRSLQQLTNQELRVNYFQGLTAYKEWLIIASESEIIAWNGKQIKRTNRFQKPFQATLKNFKCINGILYFLRGDEWISWDVSNWLEHTDQQTINYQLLWCEVGLEKMPFSSHERTFKGHYDLNRSYDQNSIVFKLRLYNEYKQNGFELFYKLKKEGTWTSLTKNGVLELQNLAPDSYQVQFKIIENETNSETLTPIIHLKIQFPWYQTWWFMVFIFLVFSVLFFVSLRIFYRKKAQKTKEAYELEQKLSELKMEALQAQMNPHFIFNAMNAIQHFIIDQETDKAMFFLGEFSRLIRNVLDYTRIKTIAMEEEFDFLLRYISIENMRYDGKIKIIAPQISSVSEVLIPPLLLQPLIENAILHGSEINGELCIEIRVNIENSGVLLEICNASATVPQKSQHRSRGKEIIEERLKHFHPEASITYIKENIEHVAKLWIPIEKEGKL